MTVVLDRSGNSNGIDPTFSLNGFQLARNQTIAAGANTTPMNVRRSTRYNQGGNYVLDVQFTGTSVQPQVLGADGLTWRSLGAAITTPGASQVFVGSGGAVRLNNPNGTDVTAVSASLS